MTQLVFGWPSGTNMTQIYFSKTTLGFYSREIHGDAIPSDAVEIAEERRLELLGEQALGKQIVGDASGHPILVEPAASTYDVLRKLEYPPITDYLDGVVKGDQAQIAAYIATCRAVKAKYPKPESV